MDWRPSPTLHFSQCPAAYTDSNSEVNPNQMQKSNVNQVGVTNLKRLQRAEQGLLLANTRNQQEGPEAVKIV
jgi:hypothetical protein